VAGRERDCMNGKVRIYPKDPDKLDDVYAVIRKYRLQFLRTSKDGESIFFEFHADKLDEKAEKDYPGIEKIEWPK